MKTKITFCFVFLCQFAIAQSSQIAKKNFCGVIFNEKYPINFKLNNIQSRFTPSEQQIEEVESIINEIYKKIYKSYIRQYIGYNDSIGNSIIIVQMLNFKHKKIIIRENYIDWETKFINGFGKFYEKNVFLYRVDIQKKTINRF